MSYRLACGVSIVVVSLSSCEYAINENGFGIMICCCALFILSLIHCVVAFVPSVAFVPFLAFGFGCLVAAEQNKLIDY